VSGTGSCPSCGSPVTFRAATTLSAVCPHCRSIVVRGGADLALVGTTNEVLVSGSALRIGLQGRRQGLTFTLIGRVQLRHGLGGVWDEWLVSFSNGRLAWLAEHQGRYVLLAEANVHNAPSLAIPDEARPGAVFVTPVGELIVVEHGIATVVAQEGELPSRVLPDARRPFVDFTSRSGRWATLDFGILGTSEPRRFFVGRELSPGELGLPARERVEPVLPRNEGAKTARCPSCGSPVSKLRTDTESLTCRHCHAVLSVQADSTLALLFAQGRLRYQPRIELGTTATLDESFFANASRGSKKRPWPARLTVTLVAHLVRSVEVDGERYTFDEYLLETTGDGFFWLIESDGKWLFARPLGAGLVDVHKQSVHVEGRVFRLEQATEARVEQVTGELYWRVRLHDTSRLTDYRSAPRTISREETPTEVVWTECLDVPAAAMERFFNVRSADNVRAADEEDDEKSPGDGKGKRFVLVLVCFIVVILLEGQCDDDEETQTGRGVSGGSGFHFGK
jgi:ribosomal protein L37AE/L43A